MTMANELERVFDKLDELKEVVQANHLSVTERLTRLETQAQLQPPVKQPCSFLTDHLDDSKITKREFLIGTCLVILSAALAFFGKYL